MTKPNIREFLRWAMPHAVTELSLTDADMPVKASQIATDPAHYLLGTIWTKCTPANLLAVYNRKYATTYTREEFTAMTADWSKDSYATDCQGLNDAFFRYVWNGGDHTTDTNADGCYRDWCGEKGLITDRKTLPLGAAVFKGSAAKKTHVGFICGFMPDGEPLVLEAQGIRYGVRINLLADRTVFAYYGIMDRRYDYGEEYPAEPLEICEGCEGEAYAALQTALNLLGYKDDDGNPLSVDGKFGRKSRQAFDWMVYNNTDITMTDVCFRVNGKPTEIILDKENDNESAVV